MTSPPASDPRSFREVAIHLHMIRQDIASLRSEIQEFRSGQQQLKQWAVMGLACPVVVGVVLTIIFKY